MPELKIERTVANESTETAAAPADFPVPPVDPTAAAPKPEPSRPSWASFRNSLGNICLALLFFVVLIPNKSPHYHSTLATDI